MSESPFLTVPQAAAFLKVVSKSTLDHLRLTGGGPPFLKLGRNVVYDKDDLINWAHQQRRLSTSDRAIQ